MTPLGGVLRGGCKGGREGGRSPITGPTLLRAAQASQPRRKAIPRARRAERLKLIIPTGKGHRTPRRRYLTPERQNPTPGRRKFTQHRRPNIPEDDAPCQKCIKIPHSPHLRNFRDTPPVTDLSQIPNFPTYFSPSLNDNRSHRSKRNLSAVKINYFCNRPAIVSA